MVDYIWEFMHSQNFDLALIIFGIFAVGGLVTCLLSPLIDRAAPYVRALVNGVLWWAHDHITGVRTLPEHETGVGEIEPIEAMAERREWEELVNVFDFGRKFALDNFDCITQMGDPGDDT